MIHRAAALLTAIVLAAVTAAGASAQSPSAAPSQPPAPSASPAPSVSTPPAIVWDTGTVRLVADAMRIRAGGQVFTGEVPGVEVGGSVGDLVSRTLEITWFEHGVEQRLNLYLAADASTWWVTEIRTRDGARDADWVTYPGPVWRVPMGGTYRGDLRFAQGAYALEFDGLVLSAFSPANLPRDLRFCRPPAPGVDPFDGRDPATFTPAEVKALLVAKGLCHSFRYEYPFEDGGGYAERWCAAPPGRVMEATTEADLVIVFVVDPVRVIHTPRPQPPIGWGC